MLVFLVLSTAVAGACALEISDEDYARFPRLYHLDDYSSCLTKANGLYCLGSFHIHQPMQYDHTYELIKEYSANPFHFNRTQLHRGYCVSERCPSSERNTSLRFEQCAAQWGKKMKLRLSLASLKYCKTHQQEYARKKNEEPYNLSKKILLTVLAALCFVNFVGTVYDVFLDDGKKNDLLSVWSIRSNWHRLSATYEDGDPRINALSPVQGIRVFLMILFIGTHGIMIHDMLYLHNPTFLEKVVQNPYFMIIMNGTSMVMIFVMISSFLLAYNLLLLSKTRELTISMLPSCVLKRVVRISPVYLLVVGFAATFWPQMRDGPMWPTLVEAESQICREKFWTHALYINNLVQPADHCLIQTWFLATDMQLYVLSSVLTLWLAKKRAAALPILAALMVASCVLNGVLAYIFDWKSLMFYVNPNLIHTLFQDVPSFYQLYTAPWGSLPACLVGLFLAHLHFELEERAIKPNDYKLFRIAYTITPTLIVLWLLAGNFLRDVTSPSFTASYVALERPVLCILAATTGLGLSNRMTGFWQNLFSWSGWTAMGRMSLSVLLVHWIINTCIAASRPQPISTSVLDITVDGVATVFLSYSIAIPLTLMVEMPILRVANTLFFKRQAKGAKSSVKSYDKLQTAKGS